MCINKSRARLPSKILLGITLFVICVKSESSICFSQDANIKSSTDNAKVDSQTHANTLTKGEVAEGWKLLFDGQSLLGWRNYQRTDVGPGWKVVDGNLVCDDPHTAGDLLTTDKYDWFELTLEYNISAGGNSGIMYHVNEVGPAAWATGPEIQLLDNAKGADPHLAGWLYALYQPATDPGTGRPLDATHPAGQWNLIKIVVTPKQCETFVNGVKYYQYVLGDSDWNSRVAKSKFAAMPDFAKKTNGHIALQGDHGQVSFRNIKVRPVKTE